MMKSISHNTAAVLLDQAVFSGTSFLTTLLVARILSISDFGIWAAYILGLYLVLSGVSAFVIQPFQVSVAGTIPRRVAIGFAVVFEISLILVLVTGVSVGTKSFDLQISFSFLCFGAGFLFHDFGRRMLLALDRGKQALLLDLTVAISSGFALLVFWQKGNLELDHLFAWLAWAYIPSLLLVLVFVRPIIPRMDAMHDALVQHFEQGKWLFMTAVTQWWSTNFLVVSAGLFLGAGALGALRLSQSLMGVLNVLLQSFENYLLPQTAKRLAVDIQLGSDYLIQVVRGAGVLFLPVLAVIVVFSTPILVLAGGQDYADFGYVLRAVGLLYVLVYLSQPLRLLIRGMMLNKHFFYGYLLSLAFGLVFSRLLISQFGLSGALTGMAISQILMMAYWTFVLQKKEIHLWKSFISF
jgi:O-antigen/teichoic acid export membrane protein